MPEATLNQPQEGEENRGVLLCLQLALSLVFGGSAAPAEAGGREIEGRLRQCGLLRGVEDDTTAWRFDVVATDSYGSLGYGNINGCCRKVSGNFGRRPHCVGRRIARLLVSLSERRMFKEDPLPHRFRQTLLARGAERAVAISRAGHRQAHGGRGA